MMLNELSALERRASFVALRLLVLMLLLALRCDSLLNTYEVSIYA